MGNIAKKRREAEYMYNQSVTYWLIRILRLASSSIEWKGLPDYIDVVRLENILNRSGSAIIGYDEYLNRYFMAANASVGNIDIDGYPMERVGIFANGQSIKFTPQTSVIIYNNSMRMADYWIFKLFAEQMADYDNAIRVNMNSQKTMPIIPASQEQQLSVENAYYDYVNNIPYILVEPNGMNIQAFKDALQFDNRRSFTSDLMIEVQRELWNRCLTFIGVNNTNIEKRERVNVQETNSNLDEILYMRRDRLNSRTFACRKMAEVFGWKQPSVKYYTEGREDIIGSIHDVGTNYSGTNVFNKDKIS